MNRAHGLILAGASLACFVVAALAYCTGPGSSAALRACRANHAYTAAMLPQCLSDYASMMAGASAWKEK